MNILAINAAHPMTRDAAASVLRSVPVQKIAHSYGEGLYLLRKHPLKYDVVVASFTPLYGRVRDYGPAWQHISEVLNAHPFAGIVLYSGAAESTLEEVATSLGHRIRWVQKGDTSKPDLFRADVSRIIGEIGIALREYRISLDRSGRVRLSEGASRSPIKVFPQHLSGVVVKPHFISRKVIYSADLEEFEYLINKHSTTEHEIHTFLEAYPEFLLGARYRTLRSHIYLARNDDSTGPLIPDFFLEPINASDFWKIVELKLPTDRIIRVINDNRKGFSAKILQAAQQLRVYRDYFDNPDYRRRMKNIGIEAFKPEVSVIIGKDYGGLSIDEIIRARADFSDLEVMTYTELLERARTMSWLIED